MRLRPWKVPGVHQVARLDNAVAVIADHYWAAKQGLEAAAIKFDAGPHAAVSTMDVVAALAKASEKPGAVAKNAGDVAAALTTAATKVDAIYEAPFLAHATMEPVNCTAHVTADSCDIWVGTQIPTVAQQAVAQTLGLKPDQVRIHNHLLGGGFGRRLEFDFIVQAALIAKQAPSGESRVEPRGGRPARHVPALLLRPVLCGPRPGWHADRLESSHRGLFDHGAILPGLVQERRRPGRRRWRRRHAI